MEKTFADGRATLILGDALDVLEGMRDEFDLVVTDPPYRLTSGGNAQQVMGGIFSHANYSNNGLLMDVIDWHHMGGPIFRACKPDADAYIMANDKQIFAAHAAFTGAGWKLHNVLTWHKGAPTRNRWYMKNQEFTLFLWKGRAKAINMPGSTQNFECPRPKDKIHPTQKPVDLMKHYILNSSKPGDMVLDPFAGSASTIVAALKAGRRAVGIERDPEIFAAAAERLEKESLSIAA